jgi:uncharacterized protein
MKNLSISLPPKIALDEEALKNHIFKLLLLKSEDEVVVQKLKQSIDARKREVVVHLELAIYINELPESQESFSFQYKSVENAKQVIVVGAGPAGLFAALRLIELGVKPVLLERGKDVRARRRDIALINKAHFVDPNSNYCFGEGGAGTYSDGKLYTRSKKRGDIRRILEILVAHGATPQILVDAHPHIGSNKLPLVVAALREQILKAGGEIHFETKVVDLIVRSNEVLGVILEKGQNIYAKSVILATGHSARDIFEILKKNKIKIEAKPFALGVRIEHTQKFVDNCQYHTPERGLLPAAAYSLVAQTHFGGVQRGVFSFCMCPGGFIVPSSSSQNELVVNGMSPSRRDSVFANSGVVVAINEVDWLKYSDFGQLAALEFQKQIEQNAYLKVCEAQGSLDGITQTMPAQRVSDFINNKISHSLNPTSYQPGLISMNFHDILPENISKPLQEGILKFGQKMKNYDSNMGQIIGIESRTSSPVRVPRDKETLEHLYTKRLYPCGEGAGYAGGIVSAAMDGERCAEAIFEKYLN